MLHSTQKIDYAFSLLLELTKNAFNEPKSLRIVSEDHGLSFYFMQKVALDLRKSGLIRAGRGIKGGYVLARGASSITVKDVIEAINGPMAIMHCLGTGALAGTCARQKGCNVRPALDFINRTILETLSKKSLSDFLPDHA